MATFLKKIGGGWIFLIIVLLFYLVFSFINGEAVMAGFKVFLSIIKRMLPILAIVFGLIFVSNLFVNNQMVLRYLGAGAKRKGWLIAIVGGILSAGPIYMWYPLLQDLKQKGMRDALIATFLYNRAVKIPLLPIMVLYFGVKLVVVLTVCMILFSIVDGYLVERFATVKVPDSQSEGE
jgi:uncharacterized membrane protein YraQ (UPF0718 family)